jgi:hypothetical protein
MFLLLKQLTLINLLNLHSTLYAVNMRLCSQDCAKTRLMYYLVHN